MFVYRIEILLKWNFPLGSLPNRIRVIFSFRDREMNEKEIDSYEGDSKEAFGSGTRNEWPSAKRKGFATASLLLSR